MNTPRFFLRAGIVAVVAMMFIFLASASYSGTLSVRAAPVGQDGTDYPFDFETLDDFDDGYPVDTDIPFDDETPFDEETPFDFETVEVPVPAVTATLTGTLPPNTFLTENAEMSGGQVTLPPSETPGPTITVYQSPTVATGTPRPTRAPASTNSGSPVDWGYFSLGFAVPVLAACGVVLYLLDRRPDLFKPRK